MFPDSLGPNALSGAGNPLGPCSLMARRRRGQPPHALCNEYNPFLKEIFRVSTGAGFVCASTRPRLALDIVPCAQEGGFLKNGGRPILGLGVFFDRCGLKMCVGTCSTSLPFPLAPSLPDCHSLACVSEASVIFSRKPYTLSKNRPKNRPHVSRVS